MDNVKLSILVTFYNQEQYVDRAISSIISQIVDFNYHIIIGDDGSDDGTLSKIYEWIQKYPDLIEVHIVSRDDGIKAPGFRASRNRLNLLKYVTGEYFMYLDGDDYYSDDNKLKIQVGILDNPDNSDCIATAHNIKLLYPNGEESLAVTAKLTESKIEPRMYWGRYYFHTDTLMIRSKVIKTIPINLVENNFNDNLITFLIIQNGNIYYIPNCMAIYSQTQGGIWTGQKKVINNIRNIFLYDLCMIINPKMKREIQKKFKSAWKDAFLLRKEYSTIDSAIISPYAVEANEKNLVYSKKWLNYNSLTIVDKFDLFTKCFGPVMYYTFIETLGKIYHKLHRTTRK